MSRANKIPIMSLLILLKTMLRSLPSLLLPLLLFANAGSALDSPGPRKGESDRTHAAIEEKADDVDDDDEESDSDGAPDQEADLDDDEDESESNDTKDQKAADVDDDDEEESDRL